MMVPVGGNAPRQLVQLGRMPRVAEYDITVHLGTTS